MADILQTTLANVFFLMKMFGLQLEFKEISLFGSDIDIKNHSLVRVMNSKQDFIPEPMLTQIPNAILGPRELMHCSGAPFTTLQWSHNEHHGITNHRHLDCLLSHLFSHTSKKTSKLRFTGLCEGNPPVTGGFPSQRPSNAENVSVWWLHHVTFRDELSQHQVLGMDARAITST